MADVRSTHLGDEQLAQYQDGELSAPEVRHLKFCSDCTRRLEELQAATSAYAELLDVTRRSPAPPAPWRSLDALIAAEEARHQPRRFLLWGAPAAAAVAAIMLVILLRNPAGPAAHRATELLERSAQAGVRAEGVLTFRTGGRLLLRPAVLVNEDTEGDPEFRHLAKLFNAAHYSWREPLSARSFQQWRGGLRARRDSVTVIRQIGEEPSYRVRTDSSDNILRSASLTLRGKDLRPASGVFQFEGEDPLEVDEPAASRTPERPERPPRTAREAPVEIPASPADTLHVLAALNEIGADIGEPVEVSRSGPSVVVRTTGLARERREQIAQVLERLPRVKLEFDSTAEPVPGSVRQKSRDRYSTGTPPGMRQHLEARLGGAIPLQETTDRVLDASWSALAVAHAVTVLANEFPPAVESLLAPADRGLLGRLHEKYVIEIHRQAGDIRAALKPALPAIPGDSPSGEQGPWQTAAHALAASAQALDEALNRLLAGSYPESESEDLLLRAARELSRLEDLISSSRGQEK